MLAWRGVGSSIHFGASFDAKGKLSGHAWTVAGGKIVVGEAGMADMTTIARFG
jgi:hypothetical protein